MGTTKKFEKAREICKMQNMTLLKIKSAEMTKSILSLFSVDVLWLDYEAIVYDQQKWLNGHTVKFESKFFHLAICISWHNFWNP